MLILLYRTGRNGWKYVHPMDICGKLMLNIVKFFKLWTLAACLFTTALAPTPVKGGIYSMFSSRRVSCASRANTLGSLCYSSSPLRAYKLVFDSNGRPNFQFVAQTALSHGCKGSPTVTSLDGQPGTAIVSQCWNFEIREVTNSVD